MNDTVNKMERILFIMNPKSGTMQAERYLTDILQLYSDAGIRTTVLMTHQSGDAREFAIRYAHEADAVVVSGGDGTLNEVIDGILTAEVSIPIGYIPSGSTNDFAASVGLPKGIMDAAEVVLNGTPKTFDIGSFNGRYFSYVASFGAFTSTSYSVPQNLKNIMGHTAYILKGIQDLVNIKKIHAKITTDAGTLNEEVHEGEFIFGAMCNSTSVGGMLKLDNFDVDMNDGMMEVLLIEAPNSFLDLNEMVRALLAGTLDAPNISFFSAREIQVEIEPDTHWTLDGEYEEGADSIQIHTLRSAVSLIV